MSTGDNCVPVKYAHLPQRMQCIGGGGGLTLPPTQYMLYGKWTEFSGVRVTLEHNKLMQTHLNKYLIQYILGENRGSLNN